MDYVSWKNESVSTAEMVPVTILALEALLGVACNLVAAVTYCRQKNNWVYNPGNAFTISLMVDDLILSGIAAPLVIATEVTKASASPKVMEYLCIGARCMLLFSAVSSATGNALLALDRGDLTIRPSKRFFRKKRAAFALAIAWLLSIASLLIPLLTAWTCHEDVVQFSSEDIYRSLNGQAANTSSQVWSNNSVQCNVTCHINRCLVNETEFKIRCTIQAIFFTCAAVTIIATYTRILHSVKRRDIKRTTKNIELNTGFHSSKKKTKLFFHRWCTCCKEKDNTLLENPKNNNEIPRTPSPCTPLPTDKQGSTVSQSTIESIPDTEESRKSEDPKTENANFLEVPTERNAGLHPGRAHFASVALSVQAFIALKRIVKEKMEIKKRKHRHLQRMTIAITLTYLLCWMPYHILPFAAMLTKRFSPEQYRCDQQECVKNGIMIKNIQQATLFQRASYPLNITFLWAFVFVCISSIANPCLYSFSREKIRKEFSKIFCKSKKINTPTNAKKNRIKLYKQKENKETKPVFKCQKTKRNNAKINLKETPKEHARHPDRELLASTNQKLIANNLV